MNYILESQKPDSSRQVFWSDFAKKTLPPSARLQSGLPDVTTVNDAMHCFFSPAGHARRRRYSEKALPVVTVNGVAPLPSAGRLAQNASQAGFLEPGSCTLRFATIQNISGLT